MRRVFIVDLVRHLCHMFNVALIQNRIKNVPYAKELRFTELG